MAEVEIVSETEGKNNWSFAVRVFDKGRTFDYQTTLSWPDYDLWCHGRVAPEKVVHKAFDFLLEREAASSILSSFDCSLIRRYFPEVDQKLPKMI